MQNHQPPHLSTPPTSHDSRVILLGLYLSEKMDNDMRIQRLKALATIASLYTSTPTPFFFFMFYTVVADQFLYCIDFERVLTGPSSVLL